MINLKCIFFVIQLLILVVKINSEPMFFRGNYFNDKPQKPEPRDESSVLEKWYSQPQDHFEPSNKEMWLQRYYVNEAYYKHSSDSPVYLLVGGEEAIEAYWMEAGLWVDSARQRGALLLQLEHRFYGSSHPTRNTSTKNLQYLTTEQALGDTLNFIVAMKETYELKESNKWILFGGSYPGSLVAWLRLKYPHLVHGAISSSAPVQAVVDFKDYFKVTAESLRTHSLDCVKTITEAFANMDQLSQDGTGKQSLTSKFNLCEALEHSQDFKTDFAQLNSILAHYISGLVQYNEIDHASNRTIDNICNILANKTLGSTSLDRFAALIKILRNSKCVEYNYQNFVNHFRNTDWEHSANKNNGKQWFFQTCHQLGFFQTSSNEQHVFGNKFPVEHFIKQCTDVFGPQYNAKFIEQQIKNTNNVYGGKAIVNSVDRIVFVQGSIDPWYPVGITNSSNSKSPAIFILGAAHCADTYSNDYNQDSPQLINARQKITNYINSWLS